MSLIGFSFELHIVALQQIHICHHLFLQEHSGRVFRLQFDEFQIVSSSHDDTILIWDFLDTDEESSDASSQQAPTGTYTYVSGNRS